jgi:hypothetical protein
MKLEINIEAALKLVVVVRYKGQELLKRWGCEMVGHI